MSLQSPRVVESLSNAPRIPEHCDTWAPSVCNARLLAFVFWRAIASGRRPRLVSSCAHPAASFFICLVWLLAVMPASKNAARSAAPEGSLTSSAECAAKPQPQGHTTVELFSAVSQATMAGDIGVVTPAVKVKCSRTGWHHADKDIRLPRHIGAKSYVAVDVRSPCAAGRFAVQRFLSASFRPLHPCCTTFLQLCHAYFAHFGLRLSQC
jgi:hypothetical protein